jgi:hypothetical protein
MKAPKHISWGVFDFQCFNSKESVGAPPFHSTHKSSHSSLSQITKKKYSSPISDTSRLLRVYKMKNKFNKITFTIQKLVDLDDLRPTPCQKQK